MKERNYIVYLHVSPSSKYYVGITKNGIKERSGVSGKRYYKNIYFKRAIQKYGWNNFEHKILVKNLTCKEACKLEEFFIQKYNSADPNFGYNLTYGGEGNTPTEHSKLLIKLHHADCKKEKNSFYGKKHTDETKKLISQNHDYSKQLGIYNKISKVVLCIETLQLFGSANLTSLYFLHRESDDINIACRRLYPFKNLHFIYWKDFVELYKNDRQKLKIFLNTKPKFIRKDMFNFELPRLSLKELYNTITEKYNKNNIINCLEYNNT